MNDRTVAKSVFKAQALRYFREVELSGEPLVITDRGKPVLRLLPYSDESPNEILASLRGTVKDYQAPLEPIGLEDWEGLSGS